MMPTPRTEYAPDSSFGWLDHDAAAADRMREVLKAFEEKETIDSLGFGVVRDALPNRMFPGTSTIQTRARYFFFVPWIYQHCERLALPPRELDGKTREMELQLIESLRAGVERVRFEGIIGGRARRNTKRLASSVYWSGLATFGFRLADASPSELRRLIPALRHRRADLQRDDNRELLHASPSLWAPLPGPPEGFPYDPITFDLTEQEAAYLAEAMQSKVPDSVLACLAAEPEAIGACESPWDIPGRLLTPALREVVEHARVFSAVSHGANILYNVMLCEAAERASLKPEGADPGGLERELEQWEDEIRGELDTVRAWAANLPAFWAIVEREGPVHPRTKGFIARWVAWVVDDPARPRTDPAVRDALQQRERAIKNPPRLSNLRALERWNGSAFGRAAFAFRFGTVQRFMEDIAHGLGRMHDAVA